MGRPIGVDGAGHDRSRDADRPERSRSRTTGATRTDAPLVSVVTPVHNTGELLDRCIRSVLDQTYPNFEYLIVENASTDDSGVIADRWAQLDDRVRVVRTPELLSQVANYNFALEHISPASAYVKICQADDRLFPHCLDDMVECGERHPSVGLISSYRFRGSALDLTGLAPEEQVLTGEEVCRRHLLHDLFLFGSPTTVMYRAGLVRARRPFFEEGRLHEDLEVCYELLKTSDFGFVHQVLSYSSLDARSLMGGMSQYLPGQLDRVIVAKRYARQFLPPEDAAHAERRALDEYYRRLARRVLRAVVVRNRAAFWAHQQRALADAGEGLRLLPLARAFLSVALEALRCPAEVTGSVRRATELRHGAPADSTCSVPVSGAGGETYTPRS